MKLPAYFALILAYMVAGYSLIAWKYHNYLRFGRRGRTLLAYLHAAIVLGNIAFFLGLVSLDYRATPSIGRQVLGLGVTNLGIFLMFWAAVHLRHAIFAPGEAGLVREGPFKLVRHPIYLGGSLAAFGLSAYAGSLWAFLYSCFLVLSLYAVSRVEERELLARFGPVYEAYRKRVAGWNPMSTWGRSWVEAEGHVTQAPHSGPRQSRRLRLGKPPAHPF